MTEQELRRKFRESAQPHDGDVYTIVMFESEAIAFAKAYADARVAEKDAEIRNLKSYISAIESDNANNSMNLDNLDAEIKRLRSGIQKVADHLWVREPRNMSWLELRDQVSILHGLLSPAPVTETLNEDQE